MALDELKENGIHLHIKEQKITNFVKKRENFDLSICSNEVTLATKNKIEVLTPPSSNYPKEILNLLSDPPIVLYAYGNTSILSNNSIAIVGTRNPSYYGIKNARDIARDLSNNGFIIISGLARGIDFAAHLGVLDTQGKTIAVLANGLLPHPKETKKFEGDLVIYPNEHKEVVNDIIYNGGTIISESPFGSRPRSFRLLARNRIVAALSIASIAIEGSKRTGTSNEIKHALKMKKQIFALKPQDILRSSAIFPQLLIERGEAIAISSADEIINSLHQKQSNVKTIDSYLNV